MARIAVIGGGVVGLCSAIALVRAGWKAVVFEKSAGRDAASWNNAGHIATEQVAPLASPASIRSVPRRLFIRGGALALPPGSARAWLPFALRMLAASTPARFAAGSAALRSLLVEALPAWQRLARGIGMPELVKAQGHWIAWESPATAAAGRRGWTMVDTGSARLTELGDDALALLQSLIRTPVADAMGFTGSGQIVDLHLLANALERALEEAGGSILRQPARLSLRGGRAQVEGLDVDQVLVAAGVRSGEVMAAAGYRVPIIAERGYHIRAPARDWPSQAPPIVFEDRSMIVTRFGDTVQASGFVEFSTPDAPPDPRKWVRLERHVADLGLPMRPPYARWMGARPTLPDYLPAIGRSRRADNLLYAFGHQHLGLTLAPITAQIIAALAGGGEPAIDIRPFDLERFGKGGRA